MLSSENPSSAVVKLVDFGSAQIITEEETGNDVPLSEASDLSQGPKAATPSYSPPEFLKQLEEASSSSSPNDCNPSKDPAFDMWALGVMLYAVLTGVHPFDLAGESTDEEIKNRILSGTKPPLQRARSITDHLSPQAIDVIAKLLEWNPQKRMTALELLENRWVRGETALRRKMSNIDKRLSDFQKFKTKLQAKAFADMVSWSGKRSNVTGDDEVGKRTSLIERAFLALDNTDEDDDDKLQLTLSGFSDLLAENMKHRCFGKD